MIGRLTGRLIDIAPGQVLVDVGGVAYEVEISGFAQSQLPPLDHGLTLHTHLVVREDARILFGFPSRDERDLFRVLIRVNGVGPRLGLAILSSLTVSHLVQCIKQNDIKRLTAVPGIGKKTAERLMIEMRDRLQEWDHLMVASPDTSAADKVNPIEADVEAALVNLGYKPQEAALALASIQWSEEEVPLISFEETIKKALNVLSGR